jgi:sarcosine oxidase subunit gamma
MTSIALSRATRDAVILVRADLSLQREQNLGIGKLVLNGHDAAALFGRIMGFDAPAAGCQVVRHEVTFAWLSPNEWLIAAHEGLLCEILRHANEQGGDQVLAVDTSHGRGVLMLSGAGARDVLATLCPLNARAEHFPVNAVARSLLGSTGVFIARLPDLDDTPRFRLVVDQSMEAYAVRLLAGPKSRSRNHA